ncbi:MAG: hypothetical protein HYX80_05820 [Chloroflexi bacterium]|nr:hypothetical protein [Chloroflexota bacterium]
MISVLDIYVAKHCFGTAEALRIAAEVGRQLPDIEVKVTIFDEISRSEAPHVIATPSYILNGKLLFLGNPRLAELVKKVRSVQSAKTKGDDNE